MMFLFIIAVWCLELWLKTAVRGRTDLHHQNPINTSVSLSKCLCQIWKKKSWSRKGQTYRRAMRKQDTPGCVISSLQPLSLPAVGGPPGQHRWGWPPAAGRARSVASRPRSPRWRRWRCRNRTSQTRSGASQLALGAGSHRPWRTVRDYTPTSDTRIKIIQIKTPEEIF